MLKIQLCLVVINQLEQVMRLGTTFIRTKRFPSLNVHNIVDLKLSKFLNSSALFILADKKMLI